MDELRYIGKPIPLVDAPLKVSGTADYVADIRVPDVLHGKVLRNPHAHARILNVDVGKALKVSGVHTIITAADTPEQRWSTADVKDQTILARDKVRYVGEEIAAVAAEDDAAAAEAVELIDVTYDLLPAVFDPEEAMAEDAPHIHEGGNITHRQVVERGDVDAALKQADAVYENTYTTPLMYQAYMEPNGTLAVPEGRGNYTVYSPFQVIFESRSLMARVLGLKPENIRVVQPFVGGGFGGKSQDDANAFITLVLAMKAERPVRMINSRWDEFQGARPRVPTKTWIRMGAKKDGTLLTKESRMVSDNGAYTGLAKGIMLTALYRPDNLYRLEHIRSEGFLVYTNKIPTGAYRGFGNPQGTFPQECAVDGLAHEMGMDPAEIRLKNVVRTGDVTAHHWKYESCGLEEAIRYCTEAVDWLGAKKRNGRIRRGLGLACAVHVSGNRLQFEWEGARAYIDLDEEGRAVVRSGDGDIGQGARTLAAVVTAEELNVGLDRVEVAETNTEDTPNTLGSFASRLALIAGHAIRNAVEDLKSKLAPVAAEMLEAAVDDIEWVGGSFRVKGLSERSMSLDEVCPEAVRRNGGEPIRGEGEWDPPSENYDPKTMAGNISVAYEFAAQMAEVEVDMETGHVQLVRLVSADDVGRMLNPLAVHGQVEGAAVQGVGFALTEEMKTEGGQVVNGNFGDYALPKAESVPSVESVAIETNDPYGPYGAKGASEGGSVPTAAAIANAIYDATGVWITELPMTAERVLTALKAQDKQIV